MIVKKNKHQNLKLVISLIFMSLIMVVSVGGLTIIKGVNANENDGMSSTATDLVEENDIIVSDYVSGAGGGNNKVQVKIESTEQAINLINNYFSSKAYIVSSTGKMGVAGEVDGVMSYGKICDLGYHDYFEHQADGRAYWEEGSKMDKFYNGFLETVFDMVMSMINKNINNLSRYYFIDEETYFSQHLSGVKFSNGFKVSESTLNSGTVYRDSNSNRLKNYGYCNRYFRWDINENTVKNASLTKTIAGYKLDFDLDAETGARDVYKRLVTWIPASVIRSMGAGTFHYSFTFDKFGNVVSFSRDETINLSLSGASMGINLTGSGKINYNFNYSVRTKDDNYKIAVDSPFAGALAAAGFRF